MEFLLRRRLRLSNYGERRFLVFCRGAELFIVDLMGEGKRWEGNCGN
jgi:hypothetical protein